MSVEIIILILLIIMFSSLIRLLNVVIRLKSQVDPAVIGAVYEKIDALTAQVNAVALTPEQQAELDALITKLEE